MKTRRTYEIKGSDKMKRCRWFFDEHPEAEEEALKRWGVENDSIGIAFSDLTVAELCEVLGGVFPERIFGKANTVKEYFRRKFWLSESLEAFARFMEMTTPPRLPGDTPSAIEPTTEEAILLTMKDFYGLHSLAEAQAMTVGEYMIARKRIYNEAAARYRSSLRVSGSR